MNADSPMPWLKAVEVLVLLAAGIGFCWWQLRDVARERERRRPSGPPHQTAGTPAGSAAGAAPGAAGPESGRAPEHRP